MNVIFINDVRLTGHVGSVTARTTASGRPVTNLRLAQNGGQSAHWFTVVCWDELAQEAAQLQPGAWIYVAGRLTTRSYTANGRKTGVVEIVAAVIQKIPNGGGKKAEPETGG